MEQYTTGASSKNVIEHPVLFNMPGLREHLEEEENILRGLHDLLFNEYSDLYFLYTGRVIQCSGLACTHALASRFPSVEALVTYYNSAITDIAKSMTPWLKKEYCVDYETYLPEEDIVPNGKGLAFHIVFIKVKSDTSPSEIDHAIQSFLGLGAQMDFPVKLTSGMNLTLRSYYKTMSHAFSAYLPSVELLEKFQEESAFISVRENLIFPIAEHYVAVSFVPWEPLTSTF